MVAALEVTLFPAESVTMQRTCMPFQVALAVAVVEAVVLPFQLLHEEAPAFLYCHWYFSPEPVALTVKVALLPAATVTFCGWVAMESTLTVTDGKHTDGDSAGIERLAAAIGDLAVELNSVPCVVRRDSLGGTNAIVPWAECGLTLLLIIPLVLERIASCLDGKCQRLARDDALALGLLCDDNTGSNRDGCSVGIDRIARAVSDDAAHLHAVP